MGSPRLVFLTFLLISTLAFAQSGTSGSSRPKARHPAAAQSASQSFDPGGISDGIYRNLSFAFSYKVPFGWVERTQEMQDDDNQRHDSDDSKARVLLAVFERPPDAAGNTINSAVVIAVEKASNYPGLKTAADYFGPMEELIAAKGFKVVGGPDEFTVSGKRLVRGDFAKDMQGVSKDMVKDRLTMQQSTLVELDRGYIVSFTFIAGDEDEAEDLIGNLSFAPRK